MIDFNSLPHDSGCYLYKDTRGRILYNGKAKSLKNRVRSYFQKNLDPKTEALVAEIDSVDFFVTSNEVEALILENNLIKELKPRYTGKVGVYKGIEW